MTPISLKEIPRKPWSQLKQEIGEWAQHNFDNNESKHPLFQQKLGDTKVDLSLAAYISEIPSGFLRALEEVSIPFTLRSLAPLLGIMEEYGKYCLAVAENNISEIRDALADMGVYLCDFCYREGFSINGIGPNPGHNLLRNPIDPLALSLPIQIGKLAHCVLKRHQGIRNMELRYTSLAEDAIAKIAYSLETLARSISPPCSYLDILNEMWEGVKVRDWKKYPGSGLPPLSPKE